MDTKSKESKEAWDRYKKSLIDLCQDINRNYFEIAHYLYDINGQKLWAIEHGSFEEFSEKILDFKKSKAYQLIEIYKVFAIELGFTPDTIREKSWTKLRALVRLHKDGKLTKGNVQEWLDKIADLRGDDFQEVIALALGKKSKNEIKQVVLKFISEDADQVAVINQAVDHVVKAQGGEISRTAALEYLCADYMAGVDPEGFKLSHRMVEMVAKFIEDKKSDDNQNKEEEEEKPKTKRRSKNEAAEADRPY